MKDFSIARNAWSGHASWSRCPRSPPCRDLEREPRLGSRSWCGQAWPATSAIGLLPASQDRVWKVPERSNRAISKLLAQVMTTTNSGAPVMSQVRTRLAAGGRWIRIIGPRSQGASTRRLSIIRSGMRFRPSSPAKSPSATKAEEPGSRDPRPSDRRNPRGDGELIGAPTAGTPSYAALAGSCLRL